MLGAKATALWRATHPSAESVRYATQPKLCLRCNKLISYAQRKNRFCGHSCAANYSNARRGRKPRLLKAHPCRSCNKLLDKKRANAYCDFYCQQAYLWSVRKAEILRTGEVISKSPRLAKRYLSETKGHQCDICQISQWLGKRLPLVLDHIDGNSDNWQLTNLRLICSNCDSLTDTYKGKNRGKGRFARRLRYQQGKSF